MNDIYEKKLQEEAARGEFVYAGIDPQGYMQKHGKWPEETEAMRKEREAAQRSADLESIRIAEYDRKGPMPQSLTEEERRQKELEDRLNTVREVDALTASSHRVEPAMAPKFANPYDNLEAQNAMERIVQIHRQEDMPKKEILEGLKTALPASSEELKTDLQSLDFRLDFMKDLVECYGQRVMDVSGFYQEDFTPEASDKVNKVVSDYANLLATLSSCGYNFGSVYDSYTARGYDPYKPNMYLSESSSIMFKRLRNGCNIDIQIPKDYNNQSPNPSADAVAVFHCLDEELKRNPNIDYLWAKLQGVPLQKFEAARKTQMAQDQAQRAEIISELSKQGEMKL